MLLLLFGILNFGKVLFWSLLYYVGVVLLRSYIISCNAHDKCFTVTYLVEFQEKIFSSPWKSWVFNAYMDNSGKSEGIACVFYFVSLFLGVSW